jgi:hypothetical protein
MASMELSITTLRDRWDSPPRRDDDVRGGLDYFWRAAANSGARHAAAAWSSTPLT